MAQSITSTASSPTPCVLSPPQGSWRQPTDFSSLLPATSHHIVFLHQPNSAPTNPIRSHPEWQANLSCSQLGTTAVSQRRSRKRYDTAMAVPIHLNTTTRSTSQCGKLGYYFNCNVNTPSNQLFLQREPIIPSHPPHSLNTHMPMITGRSWDDFDRHVVVSCHVRSQGRDIIQWQ